MSVFIGVDGGGTHTRAVVLDASGRELGRAEGLGGVVTLESPEVAVHAVATVVRAAASAAGVRLPAAALWAGLAGAGREAARQLVLQALSEAALAERVHIGTDATAAFHDAFGDGAGILLIAGTGSIALGRSADGVWLRVGGWGQRIGDEGSGYAIGASALRAVLRAEDGRGAVTALTGPVLAHCAVGTPAALVDWIELASKGDVASLVPLVHTAAASGDAVAEAILGRAVAQLESHVRAVLGCSAPLPDPVPVVLWGGLLAKGGPLRAAVVEALSTQPVSVSDLEVDPPAGAARMALGLV